MFDDTTEDTGTTGMFGALDVEEGNENIGIIPADTYLCLISGVSEVKPTTKTKDLPVEEQKQGILFTYTIMEGDYAGNDLFDWKEVPRNLSKIEFAALEDKEKTAHRKALGYLKGRLMSFGVPANEVNSVQPEDLIGRELNITVTKRNGQNAIYPDSIVPAQPTDLMTSSDGNQFI